MFAQVSMETLTKKEISLERYDENWEKGFAQDIIAHFTKESEPVYHFQDPISGHIYFDICTKCDDFWWEHHFDNDYSLPSKGKKKTKSCEERPCEPNLEPQDPDIDNFMSEKNDFDGYQIPSSWIPKKSQTPKQKLHPYYQKCLAILKKEVKKEKKVWKPFTKCVFYHLHASG